MNGAMVWITAANILYLAAYVVRDVLWLRILTVAAASFLIPFYVLQPVPLTVAIGWNALFIAINAYWIGRLVLERRPVHLTADESRLRELSFASLTRREACGLFAMGAWSEVPAGASLVQHDAVNERFSVIFRGTADVLHRGVKVAELGEGQFVGGIDLRADRAFDVDVIVRSLTSVMWWPRRRLRAFLAKRPDVALALERSVGLEVHRLLETTLSELSVVDPSRPVEPG